MSNRYGAAPPAVQDLAESRNNRTVSLTDATHHS